MFPANVNGLVWLTHLIGAATDTLFLIDKSLMISFIHNGEQVYFSGYIIHKEHLEMYTDTDAVEAILFKRLEIEAWETMMAHWFGVPYSGKLNNKEQS